MFHLEAHLTRDLTEHFWASLVYGWHKIVEGQKRLKSEE